VDISINKSVLSQQQAIEPVDTNSNRSPESIVKISSTTSTQDVMAVEQEKTLSTLNSEQAVDGEELKSAVVELNKAVQNVQRNLEFSVDDITGRAVVQVKDRTTDEIIRQMPSEEVLKLAQHVIEQQSESGTDISLMQELKA